jgi:hypothetical protein
MKTKPKPQDAFNFSGQDAAVTSDFVPFEGMNGGGGQQANTPLSMHSEMMAIRSALAQTNTLASTTMSSIKPPFKLLGNSKHRTRLRNERLKAYVEAVCRSALDQQAIQQRGGKPQVQEWHFEATAPQPRQVGQGVSGSEGPGCGAGGHGEQCGETPDEEEKERRVWEEERGSASV